MKVACVVPALDTAATIAGVLGGVRASVPNAFIIVVDDGSTDATRVAAASHADVIIRHERTMGKGAALRAGFATALAHGATLIVTLDADGQHPPTVLPMLIAATQKADVVLGRRQRVGTGMPAQRRLSNWMSSRIVSAIAGCRIEDSQCGLRVITNDVVRRVAARGDRYEYETEFLVGAARAGFRIASVEIPTVYEGGRSHFRSFRDTSRLVVAMLRLALTPAR